jgi:hypothetical protein
MVDRYPDTGRDHCLFRQQWYPGPEQDRCCRRLSTQPGALVFTSWNLPMYSDQWARGSGILLGEDVRGRPSDTVEIGVHMVPDS